MIFTAEQEEIFRHIETSTKHLIVEARAGAAKSTTIVASVGKRKGSTLILAFNKSVKEEMMTKVPPSVTVKTMHSLGMSCWQQYIGKRLNVKESKINAIFDEVKAVHEEDISESWKDILDAVRAAKSKGAAPEGDKIRPIVSMAEFFDEFGLELSQLEQIVVEEILTLSIVYAKQGLIDYDDMVYCPAIFPVSPPFFHTIYVDEAQDLSPTNHVLLLRMAASRLTKIIAVGDPFQAIYGFRGAEENSIKILRSGLDADTLYLTTNFRCPKAVIAEALWRAPDMQAWEKAQEGKVETLTTFELKEVPKNATILCRNNAPLFNLALAFFLEGIACEFVGRDISEGVVKILSSLSKKHSIGKEEVKQRLAKWKETQKKRIKDKRLVEDRFLCLSIFVERAETLGGAIKLAEQIAKANGRIKLMTGHRAKGQQFPHVYILDKHLCKDSGQDPNILYVMQTRAQETLTYVSSDMVVRAGE